MDSNHRPPRYKLGALPTELYSLKSVLTIIYRLGKKKTPVVFRGVTSSIKNGG